MGVLPLHPLPGPGGSQHLAAAESHAGVPCHRADVSPPLSPSLTALVPPSPGIYVCAKCGHELFSSRAKYEHSSPWPAFTETLRGDSVAKREDRPGALKVPIPEPLGCNEKTTPGLVFREPVRKPDCCQPLPLLLQVTCGKCGNGLGHEFLNDGPKKGQSRF